MSRYMAAYDVSEGRIRTRLARVLMRYGTRVQASVFELWLTGDDLAELKREVGALLAASDAFDLMPIDTHAQRKRIRWQRGFDDDPVVELG